MFQIEDQGTLLNITCQSLIESQLIIVDRPFKNIYHMALSHFNGEINIFRTNEKTILFICYCLKSYFFFNQEKNLEHIL